MKNRVITISREFGSGGRTIGKKVAEKLGIPCYDAEIIEKMAKETGFAPDYVKEAGEYAPGSFLSSAFSNRMFGPTNEDILWEHQCNTITALAEKGPCVIVGRCADYILQDTADCLKVFIHADLAFRAKRIVEVYGQREQSPEERLRDKDKRRAAYHRFYTNMKCPVDTGNLRNSITHVVDEQEPAAIIGTNNEYAAYVDSQISFGCSPV